MTRESVSLSAFDRAMTLFLNRLGLPLVDPKPQAYRLNFDNENPLYLIAKPNGWLEIMTWVGCIDEDKADRIAPALLNLQQQQGEGVLICIGMNRLDGKVSARARLRLPDWHSDDMLATDDMIAAIQALRAHAAAANTIMKAQQTQPF